MQKGIRRYFLSKESSVGLPDLYLGGRVQQVVLENRVKAWAFIPSQYVQAVVKDVEDSLKKEGEKFPAKVDMLIQISYQSELLDMTLELSPYVAVYFQLLIGLLCWIVELGKIDVCVECSMLSSHLALP